MKEAFGFVKNAFATSVYSSKMTLLGLFGMPKTFIRAHQLIERGLGTPITIRSIIFEYNNEFKSLLRSTSNYSKLLKLIK